MSAASERRESNLYFTPLEELAGGETRVIDLRGVDAFTPWYAAGAHTIQACDETGTALPGATADAAPTSGTRTPVESPFVKVVADGGNAITIARLGHL